MPSASLAASESLDNDENAYQKCSRMHAAYESAFDKLQQQDAPMQQPAPMLTRHTVDCACAHAQVCR